MNGPLTVLVCGDRRWCWNEQEQRGWRPGDGERVGEPDYDLLMATLDEVMMQEGIRSIIEGDATGADKLAGHWAIVNRTGLHEVPAEWGKYHRAAGPERNGRMLELLLTSFERRVIAFHRDIEHSKGTADMVRRAQKAGVPVSVIG